MRPTRTRLWDRDEVTIDGVTRDRVESAARAAADKKAVDVVALDVSEHLALTDAFLICSGTNERQVDAIVDGIEEAILAAESDVEVLEQKINDPAFQADNYAEIPALLDDLDRRKSAVAAMYDRWAELEELRAAGA